jgi:hypothetical protein
LKDVVANVLKGHAPWLRHRNNFFTQKLNGTF